MSQFAVRTEALTKSYSDVPVVRGLNLEIEPGEVYGFLGPNGAGKTTTMRLLTGLLEPTGGDGWVCGDHVTDREAVSRHVGYLPERPPLYEELTGREQLEFVAQLRGQPADTATETATALLDRFGLTDDGDKRIEAYSTGMRKKAGLAQAVLHEPAVLFLDEPTAGLDPRAARSVRTELRRLADAGTTVFLSSHLLSVVTELTDRVGLLTDGTLVAEGPPDEVADRVDSEELEDAFIELTGD
ncbi:ABC transporter ATP-binding protein [Halobacteriales archaeon SW_6_65_46]|nr:MAG: ABC transporter ATP-binding protein [Halobacteriales archaeon SW_6_65_46]